MAISLMYTVKIVLHFILYFSFHLFHSQNFFHLFFGFDTVLNRVEWPIISLFPYFYIWSHATFGTIRNTVYRFYCNSLWCKFFKKGNSLFRTKSLATGWTCANDDSSLQWFGTQYSRRSKIVVVKNKAFGKSCSKKYGDKYQLGKHGVIESNQTRTANNEKFQHGRCLFEKEKSWGCRIYVAFRMVRHHSYICTGRTSERVFSKKQKFNCNSTSTIL